MPRFAANISMLFTELPFMDRFDAAARAGFTAVEFLFPYEHEARAIASALSRNGLHSALFNMPPGAWPQERGLACLAERQVDFRAGVAQALDYARRIGTRQLHMMAGLVPAGAEAAACRRTFLENLAYAADTCAPHGIDVLIEPINTRDMPGYFLNYQQQAHDLREACGASNVKVQMDFYHAQIMEGDVLSTFERYKPHIGHIQIAGVPARHEPDTGELNYTWLFEQLDLHGYDGWIGCEYRPATTTEAGLKWMAPYQQR